MSDCLKFNLFFWALTSTVRPGFYYRIPFEHSISVCLLVQQSVYDFYDLSLTHCSICFIMALLFLDSAECVFYDIQDDNRIHVLEMRECHFVVKIRGCIFYFCVVC